VVRDPRFESLCGEYDEGRFKSAYKFLYAETLPKEKEELQRQLKRAKDEEERKKIKRRLAQIEQSLKSERQRQKKVGREMELKRQEREAVKAGKKPFYHTKSSRRREELYEKYQELK
ncbi:unnamed protein product, partial [Closterium sp. Yama58-4]